jgi:hypothetical protein
MIEVAEHFYDDDPACGHADVRTRLADVSYFFLGNGLIQAAVQFAPSGEGTPLGLLVMNPERLAKKRDALTMHPTLGLEPTVIHLGAPGAHEGVAEPRAPALEGLQVAWADAAGAPQVVATWSSDMGSVTERFSCPDPDTARLRRDVRVKLSQGRRELHVRTGTGADDVCAVLTPDASGVVAARLVYTLGATGTSVQVELSDDDAGASLPADGEAGTRTEFGNKLLDRWFAASCCQLPAVVSRQGRVDSSVWQYNREWVRDQALVALALLLIGRKDLAETILARLLREFITVDGAPVDSSEVRSKDEVELDQNGVLLYVLHEYVNWTGDQTLAARFWDRIVAVADYPLQTEFRHPASGMLHNCREFWERHRVHGIDPGFELAHQMFVSFGLARAAKLARLMSRPEEAERWEKAGQSLREAALTDPVFALIDEGRLIKRRRLDGSVQETIAALPEAQLPHGVPLAQPGPHYLNPDTSTMLPIVFGWIPATTEEARRTIQDVGRLWNQAWTDGGYGRYHVTSEADSPGGWPFASLFVARAAVQAGDDERAWRVLRWLDSVPGAAAGSWFEFYGPRVAPPFPQVGVIPWTWAEMIFLLVFDVLGVRPGEHFVHLAPRPLSGLDHLSARLPLRGHWLHLDVRVSPESGSSSCRCDGHEIAGEGGEWLIPHEAKDRTVEIVLCR